MLMRPSLTSKNIIHPFSISELGVFGQDGAFQKNTHAHE